MANSNKAKMATIVTGEIQAGINRMCILKSQFSQKKKNNFQIIVCLSFSGYQ